MAKVKLLDPSDPRRKLDRYELIGEIATGGMATVFLARRSGVGGFQRFVAIKRLHPHLANEPEFVEMFLDEARLAALIHHPNVVPILEVGETEAGYYLVMEYVEGDTLSRIVARTMSLGQMPPRHVVLRMVLDALAGLHAAHELRDDRGQLLGLVHRDCSPQNVLVGVDGTARITDFGVARASSRLTSTAHGKLKGKLAYMAPEQTRGDELDRRTDLFAMGIIVWEVLCGKRLFKADSEAATLQRILVEPIRPPSEVNPTIPKCFDAVLMRALDRDQERRYQTAADFGDALEAAGREAAKANVTDIGVASPREVASFVQSVLGQEIGAQRESVRAWLAQSDSGQPLVIGVAQGVQSAYARAKKSPVPGAELPATQIDPSLLRSGGDAQARAAAPVVPHFEVAADVTMRFALEQPKHEPPPAPSSPPPRPEAPRPVPVPKQSSPTLLGQGPPARPEPAADAPGLPRDSVTIREGSSNPFAPPVLDDPEDAVTIARPNSAPPASAMQPAVKTARGLFAEPLLAEARAKLEAGGQSFVDKPLSAGPSPTPRMPGTLAEQAGAAGAGEHAAEAADRGAAIVDSVPVAGAPARGPRTLISSTGMAGVGEVSTGGFTPGSMTLSAQAALNHDALDPTVIHSVPKRGYGKYIVVVAAFLVVFGTGLFIVRSRQQAADDQSKNAGRPTASAATTTAAATATATASAEPRSTAAGSISPKASGGASASALVASATTAEVSATHAPDPPRTSGRKVKPTSAPTSTPTSTATSKPPPPPPPPPTGEDLSNPYK